MDEHEAYLSKRHHKIQGSPLSNLCFFFGNSCCKCDLEQFVLNVRMKRNVREQACLGWRVYSTLHSPSSIIHNSQNDWVIAVEGKTGRVE